MQPPRRSQRSITNQHQYQTPLDASYLRGDPERGTMARQEDRAETDINTIARRFGLTGQAPPMRQPQYGVALDDDVDLQQTYIMRADAQRAFMQMPREVRDKYKNWMAMLDAIHTGDLKVKDLNAEPPKPDPTPAPEPAPTPAPEAK